MAKAKNISIESVPVGEWDTLKNWTWGEQEASDPVARPSHYANAGHIECIDYIISNLGAEGAIAFCQGNVVKYLHRHKQKNGLQDLEKASWYLDKMIELVMENGED